ncbi:hypothetical protein HK099_003965 [Clydaea vesicula]|uniref:Uncharacterized protein n=1 Tax=Clydaea vesicula TaxID=447962 RepID=A0AAD5XYZ4_9FUNG|nr:hypothetical protein HK099_003965 [Clydaea vesicula]
MDFYSILCYFKLTSFISESYMEKLSKNNCQICNSTERFHTTPSFPCTNLANCEYCVPCEICSLSNNEKSSHSELQSLPLNDSILNCSLPLNDSILNSDDSLATPLRDTIPRVGRKKKTSSVIGLIGLNDVPSNTTEKKELQSVAGTLANSKRYRRAQSGLSETKNLAKISPVFNRPRAITDETLLESKLQALKVETDPRSQATVEVGGNTGAKLATDEIIEPERISSTVQIIKEVIEGQPVDRNSAIRSSWGRKGGMHASMELLTEKKITKRTTLIFESRNNSSENFPDASIRNSVKIESKLSNVISLTSPPSLINILKDKHNMNEINLVQNTSASNLASLQNTNNSPSNESVLRKNSQESVIPGNQRNSTFSLKSSKNKFSKSFDQLFQKKIKPFTSEILNDGGSPAANSDLSTVNHSSLSTSPAVLNSVNSNETFHMLKKDQNNSNSGNKLISSATRSNQFIIGAENVNPTANNLATFPPDISLKVIFGSKLASNRTISQLLWAAKCYENVKTEAIWNENVKEADSSTDDVTDEIKYRILNIFSDGRITELEYKHDIEEQCDFVKAGKPLDLLDALIFPLDQDATFAEAFLATYRFFIPSEKVLDSLLEWYNVDLYEDCLSSEELFLKRNRKLIQKRSIKVILMWIKNYWLDFVLSKKLFQDLNFFVESLSLTSFGDNQKLSQAIREQRLSWYTTLYIPAFPLKKKKIPQQLPDVLTITAPTKKTLALTIEAIDLAKQLTLIDHFFFRQIKPDSYLHLLEINFSKTEGGKNSALKVVLEYVEWFKMISTYTCSVILREETTKKRISALKQFIRTAKELRSLQNYNTFFAVMSGIKRPAIIGLQPVWEQIPLKYIDAFQTMDNLLVFDEEMGYTTYNSEFKLAEPPAIPFFAAYMQDVIEIYDGLPTFTDDLVKAESNKNNNQKDFSKQNSMNLNCLQKDAFSRTLDDDDPLLQKTINFEKFYNLSNLIIKHERFRKVNFQLEIKEPGTTNGINPNMQNATVASQLSTAASLMQNSQENAGNFLKHLREFINSNNFEESRLDDLNF